MDISWEDSIKSGHDKINREQMRYFVASQIKQAIYKDPAFKFFHSLGIFNFLQGFRSDNIDLGVFHLYWDENAGDVGANNWREHWYEPGEEVRPVKTEGAGIVDRQKLMNWWNAEHSKIRAGVMLKQEEIKVKEEDDEPWNHIPEPEWGNC